MLPKENKVNSLFYKVFSRKPIKVVSGELFNIKVYKTDNKEFKMSVIVSKKVSKKAVVRNGLKRKIYAVVEEDKDSFQEGKTYIFYVKKELISSSFSEVKNDFLKIKKLI